jgi:hypothetical protein
MLPRILLILGLGLAALLSGRGRRALPAARRSPGEASPDPPDRGSLGQRMLAARRMAVLEPSTRVFAKAVLDWCRENGIPATLGETYRSWADQDRIDPARTGIAPGEFGWHSVGRAFHLVLRRPDGSLDEGAYRRVGAEVRRRGGAWMGDRVMRSRSGKPFVDLAHFEYHPGWSRLSQYRGTALAERELAEAERRANT